MSAKKFCSRDCSFLFRTNEKHHAWKGQKASYSAAHKWMANNFKKIDSCFKCYGNKPRTEWANVSGKYKRDQNDWIELCSSCHRHFDTNKIVRIEIMEKITAKTAKK
jgi:hypothetical protein